ncbi:SCO2521 family protein [Nocardia sp. NBC_01377]|uniref:SCO2521 family protein n=1 Tax=Nocardia sp. NBC_01377 TaxID=2903595 RepID=UPI003245B9C0
MAGGSTSAPLVVLGEVRTCLVPDSSTLSRGAVEELLALVPGRRVTSRQRPIAWASSPTTAVGVDCRLATVSRSAGRAVGTVGVNAVVVGGRVLSSSAKTTVTDAEMGRRNVWSHYLERVGVIELLSRSRAGIDTAADLAEGFLMPDEPQADTLDLESISDRLLMTVRMNATLNQKSPIPTDTTRLRWAARIANVSSPAVVFRVQDETVRTALITVRDQAELAAVHRLCEDLALHDWLLTVIDAEVERADLFRSASPESVSVLAPLLEHLVCLWMPGAHVPVGLQPAWDQLQADPGFTDQWNARVGQLRDRMTVATLAALHRTGVRSTEW